MFNPSIIPINVMEMKMKMKMKMEMEMKKKESCMWLVKQCDIKNFFKKELEN
jgi:hypothetical protein